MASRTTQTIQLAAGQLQRLRTAHEKNARARATEATELERRLGASLGFAAVAIMTLAALMDILSFFDVQAVVSWLVTLIGTLVALRINRIRRAKHDIAEAAAIRTRQHEVLRQRLRTAAAAAGRSALLAPATGVSYRFSSYLTRYLVQSVVMQLFELIPIVNWLPTFMAKHYRDIMNQRRELREAKEMMIPYRALLVRIDALERFELDYAQAQFTAQMATVAGQRIERSVAEQTVVRTPDIARPGTSVPGRRAEPLPPVSTIPMRDVAGASSRPSMAPVRTVPVSDVLATT